MDWMKGENQALARREVTRKHGDEVVVDFMDIRTSAASAAQTELIRRVQAQNPPFPVLLLNGNPRITGPFDVRMLLDMIETELDRDL